MRKLILSAFALLSAALAYSPAFAGMTCNTFNGHTWCGDGHGYSSQSQTFNNRTWGWDNQGNNWTTNRFGNQSWTTTNCALYGRC